MNNSLSDTQGMKYLKEGLKKLEGLYPNSRSSNMAD